MFPTGDLLVTLFFLGRCPLGLAQRPSRVVLGLHIPGDSTPFGVTRSNSTKCAPQASRFSYSCVADIPSFKSQLSLLLTILAEGAIALSVTLSGGALFAS